MSQHQGNKSSKQGRPANKGPRQQPGAAAASRDHRRRPSDSDARPSTSKVPGKTQASSPKHHQQQEQQQHGDKGPNAHQIKLMLNYVSKADDGKMPVFVLKARMASDGNLRRFTTGIPLEDLLEDLRPFHLSSSHGGSERVVKAVTKLEICESFSTEKACLLGDMCPKLHICKPYVLDQKCMGKGCPFGHDLKDGHNHPLMKEHCLDILPLEYVRKMLLQNYIGQNFRVCIKHSTKEGCKFKDQCKWLHVCKYFMQNRCTTKGQCSRSHDLMGPQPRLKLARHGIDAEKHVGLIIQELKDGYMFRSSEDGGGADNDSVNTDTSRVSSKYQQEKKKRPKEVAEPSSKQKEGETARPTPHQLKLMLNYICKADDGKMPVSALQASMVSNGSLKGLTMGIPLEDLLEDFLPFSFGSVPGAEPLVKAVTKLEICESFSTERACLLGDMCPKLHICKPYVLDQKCMGKGCPIGHELKDSHNLPLLKDHCLDILPHDCVKKMLLQNYIRQNFRVCIKHSTKEGCKFKDQCKWLHVCKYFMQNRCTIKGQCSRMHDLMGPQPWLLLAKHGIDAEKHVGLIIQELKDGYVFRSSEDGGGADNDSVNTDTSRASSKYQEKKNQQPRVSPRETVAPSEKPDQSRKKRSRRPKKSSIEGGLLPTPQPTIGQQQAMHILLFEVCEAGGTVSVMDLIACTKKNRDLDRLIQSSAANLERILMKWPNLFRLEKQAGGETRVEAFTSLTLCTKVGSREGCTGECEKLHLCRNFVTNTCNFGKVDKAAGKVTNPCRFGHQVREPHNLKVLEQHNLHKVRAQHVKLLVRANGHLQGKPMICRFYNSPRGCRFGASTSSKTSTCKAMHVCFHHVKGTCSRGRQCPRCHSLLDRQPRAILLRHGINIRRHNEDIIQELREMMATDDKPESVLGDQDQDDLTDDEEDDDNLMTFSEDELIHFSSESGTDSDETEPPLISFDTAPPVPSFAPLVPLPMGSDVASQKQKPLQDPFDLVHQEHPLSPARPRKSAASPADDTPPEICLYHMRGQCGYKDSCRNHHCSSPYQWQELQGGRWTNFSAKENGDLEVNFCDPSKTECFIGDLVICPKRIDFTRMVLTEAGNSKSTRPVRRLSTPSSVEKPSHYKGTTRWEWYWEHGKSKWIEYGGEDPYNATRTGVSSSEIEEKFVQDPFGGILFTVENNRYILDFKKMVQKNLDSNAQRCVRRRPCFSLPEEKSDDPMSGLKEMMKALVDKMQQLETKGQEAGVPDAAAAAEPAIPHNWVMDSPMEAGGFQLVMLSQSGKGSQEYKQVSKLFHHTLGHKTIRSVQRIQNLELWEAFQRKKASMQKKLPEGATVSERHLFHGTSQTYVDPICQQGFDWRVSGLSVGTKYGKGSYFARDARFSACYADRSNSKLFLVRVLVGEYAQGKPDIVRPPPRDPKKPLVDLYDSCVDKMDDPSIFVIFNQDQAYPEWIIEY